MKRSCQISSQAALLALTSFAIVLGVSRAYGYGIALWSGTCILIGTLTGFLVGAWSKRCRTAVLGAICGAFVVSGCTFAYYLVRAFHLSMMQPIWPLAMTEWFDRYYTNDRWVLILAAIAGAVPAAAVVATRDRRMLITLAASAGWSFALGGTASAVFWIHAWVTNSSGPLFHPFVLAMILLFTAACSLLWALWGLVSGAFIAGAYRLLRRLATARTGANGKEGGSQPS